MKQNIALLKNIASSNEMFGFWIYILSDCILFATLISVYFVFQTHTANFISSKDIFNLPYVFIETMLLLLSSFSFGIAKENFKYLKSTVFWLCITFFLGLFFIFMEIYEFYELYIHGYTCSKSAFLSSFYTIIGTHGLHVLIGLIWMLNIIAQLLKFGNTSEIKIKLYLLGIFWHFLDIIWIIVFSFIFLLGAI